MKKKVLLLVVVIVAVMCSCKSKIQEGDFVFLYDPLSGSSGSTYLIKYTGNDTSVEVPAVIKGRPVNGADEGAFKNLPNIQSIRFQGEKTSLFNGAFENCPNLRSVTIDGETGYIANGAFINCPSMPTKTASSGSGSSSGNSASKSGVVGTWKRISARSTGGNTNSSTWKTVDDSRLGSGVNIPSQFVVHSNGTASAGNLHFTWSGSGSNINFSYSGSGNFKASYNASRGQIYMQMPTIYNGKVDLLAITYE